MNKNSKSREKKRAKKEKKRHLPCFQSSNKNNTHAKSTCMQSIKPEAFLVPNEHCNERRKLDRQNCLQPDIK